MAAKRIISRPAIIFGKPCFEGTRIPVDLIQEGLAAGTPVEQLLDGYPRLTREDIEAARSYSLPPTPRP